MDKLNDKHAGNSGETLTTSSQRGFSKKKSSELDSFCILHQIRPQSQAYQVAGQDKDSTNADLLKP
jgi:hypothetical protein